VGSNAIRFPKVYLAIGYTDLRSGIDRLATLVRKKFNLDPFPKDVLFLFCGRRRDRFKGLVWRGDGFLLVYKRIEDGYVQWPRDSDEMADISPGEFRSLLDGFQILQKPTVREAGCTEIA
jgi:transposase